jgi:hypothetical protein
LIEPARRASKASQASIAASSVAVTTFESIPDDVLDRLRDVSAIDARRSPGFVYLRLTPRRVQSWWSMDELRAPTITRDGRWLA